MMFLLDTNVLSELINRDPDERVIHWFENVQESHARISAITIAELNRGIIRLPEGRKKNDLTVWFDDVLSSFQGRILDIDTSIALQWGTILAESEKRGMRISVMDGFIAATAYVHGAIIVTRNTKDFEGLPVQVLNPWL